MKICRINSFKSKLRHCAIDEKGTASVEFVIWLPVMALLFGLVVDTALVMGGRSQILRIVQDTNRAVSIGRITTSEDAQAIMLANISTFAPDATASTTLTDGIISSTVSVPVGNLAATGLVDAFSGFIVTVTAQHLAEN